MVSYMAVPSFQVHRFSLPGLPVAAAPPLRPINAPSFMPPYQGFMVPL
jgi:hypothetical protein